MANIINASKTSTTGLVQTADGSGVLQLQADGVTGLTVGTGGVLTAANGIVMSLMTLGTAVAGEFEYDGRVPYFTPLGTQRGVLPGMQYYRLNSSLAGTNALGNQSVFGKAVTLTGSTTYRYEFFISITKSAGTTSHAVTVAFTGTATLNNISTSVLYTYNTVTPGVGSTNIAIGSYSSASAIAGTAAMTAASNQYICQGFGTVSINAGGTFIPNYNLSAAPGGAYSTDIGSYFLIYPIGASGNDINVGTWA